MGTLIKVKMEGVWGGRTGYICVGTMDRWSEVGLSKHTTTPSVQMTDGPSGRTMDRPSLGGKWDMDRQGQIDGFSRLIVSEGGYQGALH